MIRKLIVVVLLALCVWTALAWLQGYWVFNTYFFGPRDGSYLTVDVRPKCVWFDWSLRLSRPCPTSQRYGSFLGFAVWKHSSREQSPIVYRTSYGVLLPFWAICAALLAYPMLSAWRWARAPTRRWERHDWLPRGPRLIVSLAVFTGAAYLLGHSAADVFCRMIWGRNYYLDSPFAGAPLAWVQSVFAIAFAAALALFVNKLLTVRVVTLQTNTCRNCDYDLTGNTSGTCPECGTTI